MKTYIKRGNKNYKERRMLDELEPVLSAKKEKDANFTFTPARNFEELKKLYNNHVVQDVESEDIEETTETQTIEKEENMAEEVAEEVKEVNDTSTNSQFIDPFNQSEPIVRDYVFGDESIGKDKSKKSSFGKTSFDEPTNFEEAFVIPDDEEENTEK